jgi:hypothetical protein
MHHRAIAVLLAAASAALVSAPPAGAGTARTEQASAPCPNQPASKASESIRIESDYRTVSRFVVDNPCSAWAQVTNLGAARDRTFRVYVAPGAHVSWGPKEIGRYGITAERSNGFWLNFHPVRTCSTRIEYVVARSSPAHRTTSC